MGASKSQQKNGLGEEKKYPDLTAPIDEMEERRPEQN